MDQAKALAILKSGKNVFLTGSAGTGKTYVLNEYISYLKLRKVPVAVTASTGIASTHMNGMTIHSWSGIGIKNMLSTAHLLNMRKKKYLTQQLENAQVLIVDEISMLHRNQLDMVNQVLKFFKEAEEPFGGIQVVFSGDFFQLPPIGDAPMREKFAFMSNAWVEANLTVCYLTEQYRQEDNILNSILNEIRSGTLSEESRHKLSNTQHHNLQGDTVITKLYTHNVDVDSLNNQALLSLPGTMKTFVAKQKGNTKILETFKKSVQAAETIKLKKGAKVMFVKNNPDAGYINGTLGEVIGFSDNGLPKVELLDGKKLEVKEESWTIENDTGKKLATYEQIPIRLAWAITIHKSQGMTLDAAEIDLSKTFERGQGYVALSRLKNLRTLKLLGFNEMAVQVDALALKADVRFQELSLEAASKFNDLHVLEHEALSFIERCGGITDTEEIEKRAKKKKHKVSKKNTYEVTKEYVEKELSIEEISEARGISKGTVINHLAKLKEINPDLNIAHLEQDASQFEKIKEAYETVYSNSEEPIKLTPIFKKLNGQFSFDDIKLSLLFLDNK